MQLYIDLIFYSTPVVIIIGLLIFHWGRFSGVRQANKASLGVGTWLEFNNRSTGTPSKNPIGQGVVIGKDKWGRYTVWIAEPWVELNQGKKRYFALNDYSGICILPPSRISADVLDLTMKALREQLVKDEIFKDRVFPAGFLELMNIIH